VSSHFLPVYGANADDEADELAAALAALVAGGASGDARTLERLAKCRRIAGVAALLAEADIDTFRMRLADSARTWCDALERVAVPGAASKCSGLFDALAVDDWETARRIATALRGVAWRPEAEYEEGWLYTQVLASRLASGEDGAEDRRALLERYRELEGDAVDWRLEIAAALEQRDGAAFEAALEGLMLAERDDYAYLRERDALPPEELATLACVSVEGIALWRLGRRAGFALQEDYLFVPSLALQGVPPPIAASRG
jgi:hypothetical protein